MIVYRLCKIDEVTKIMEEKSLINVSVPGKVFIEKQQKKNINSHNYNINFSYLHFFKDIASIFYYYTEGLYICTYDIPEDILEKYKGFGYYTDYRTFSKIEQAEEYAVPNFELSFDNLIKIDRIKDIIDFEDYVFDPSLEDEIETIYQKNNKKLIRNKKH